MTTCMWHSTQYQHMGLALSFIHSYWPSKYIDGLVQDCSIFSALVLEISQSWTKPSMSTYVKRIFTTGHGWTNLTWIGLLFWPQGPYVRWQGCRLHGLLSRYVKLRVAHALGMPLRFPRHRLQRKPLVNDPGMDHGTCVTHVPWCMSGSLTRGKTFQAFPAHVQPAILRIWQEARGMEAVSSLPALLGESTGHRAKLWSFLCW